LVRFVVNGGDETSEVIPVRVGQDAAAGMTGEQRSVGEDDEAAEAAAEHHRLIQPLKGDGRLVSTWLFESDLYPGSPRRGNRTRSTASPTSRASPRP
jgi:hypothetical protein